jgi:hypothetical protein
MVSKAWRYQHLRSNEVLAGFEAGGTDQRKTP